MRRGNTVKNQPVGTVRSADSGSVDNVVRSDLTAQDRCDRCVAAAVVRTVFIHADGTRELLFCGHHFNQHEDKLVAAGAAVDDFRTVGQ